MILAAATVGMVVATTACSSDEPKPPASSASPTPAPSYSGPPIPGLAATPIWGIERTAGEDEVLAFGDVVAIPAQKQDTENIVLEFRNATDGKLRTTLTVKQPPHQDNNPSYEFRTGTWKGDAVLYFRHTDTTKSDGLSSEKHTEVVDAYDTNAKLVGSAKKPDGKKGSISLVNGWVLTSTDDGDASVSTIEGTVIVDSLCGKLTRLSCSVDVSDNRVNFYDQYTAAIAGNLAFTTEKRDAADGRRLVATDLTTGKVAWNSDDIAAPPGVPSKLDGINALPITMIGDRLVMHWRHTTKGSSGTPQDTRIALHDPATGKVVLAGPVVPIVTGSKISPVPTYVVNADASVAIVSSGANKPRTTAIDLTNGELLWTQSADEKNLWPYSIIGTVLFGHRDGPGDRDDPIAVELRTKNVIADLSEGSKNTPVPRAMPNGNALLLDGDRVFVFPPK